jgi:hypothetical protein
MRALMLLPDPSTAPDRWTERTFELRNLATLTGRCFECGVGAWFTGVDHHEIRHSEFRHAPKCRCGDDRIRAHLRHRGLELGEERYLVYLVDLETGHYALEGAA